MNERLFAEPLLAWFPLVQRFRPPALPLTTRIRELTEQAEQLTTGDAHQQAIRAAEICNKAALIASDCALPDLARRICWSQYEVFEQAAPLPTWAAELALQPLLNIARQLIREGDGNGAHAALDALFQATRAGTPTQVADRTVNLRALTNSAEGQKAVRTLVWAALLADGTRALVRAGRWREAAAAASANRGVGARLLDGRQITILALAQTGQQSDAIALIEQSRLIEPWERAIQNLLRVAFHDAGSAPRTSTDKMFSAVLALQQQPAPGTTLFRTKANIGTLALAASYAKEQSQLVQADIMAMAEADAYAAREALAYTPLRHEMSIDRRCLLTDLVRTAGLDAGALPEPLCCELMRAAKVSEARLGLCVGRGGSSSGEVEEVHS